VSTCIEQITHPPHERRELTPGGLPVVVERRLVERQLRNLVLSEARCRSERQDGPRREAVQVRRAADLVDQRVDVIDLALDGVRLRISAVAPNDEA
jgi:hypothetical protein